MASNKGDRLSELGSISVLSAFMVRHLSVMAQRGGLFSITSATITVSSESNIALISVSALRRCDAPCICLSEYDVSVLCRFRLLAACM